MIRVIVFVTAATLLFSDVAFAQIVEPIRPPAVVTMPPPVIAPSTIAADDTGTQCAASSHTHTNASASHAGSSRSASATRGD